MAAGLFALERLPAELWNLWQRKTGLFKQDQNGQISYLYGISFTRVDTTPASVPGRILPTAFNHVKNVVMSLKMLVTGQVSAGDVSGPVGIVGMMTDVATESKTTKIALLNLLSFGAFIAINLAVMNLLPLPALDGGRIFFLLLNGLWMLVFRRRIDPKYESYVHVAGLLALLALMAVVTFNDLVRIFGG